MIKIKSLILASALVATSCAAFASDVLPPSAKAVPYPAVYNWTGFYAGLHAGGTFGNASVTDINGGVPPGPFGYNPSGFIGGVNGGYNYQFANNIVAGIEVDLGYNGLSGKSVIGSANAAAHQDLTLSGGFYANATGRVGYAFGAFLPYVKGGWAYFDGNAKQQTTNVGYTPTGTGAFNGSVFGGGLEYMLWRNVSVKVEYLHYDFGDRGGKQTSLTDPPIGFQYLNNTSLKSDAVTIGANWHFN